MRGVRDGMARVNQLAERREDRIAAAVHMVKDMMIPRTEEGVNINITVEILSCSALRTGELQDESVLLVLQVFLNLFCGVHFFLFSPITVNRRSQLTAFLPGGSSNPPWSHRKKGSSFLPLRPPAPYPTLLR